MRADSDRTAYARRPAACRPAPRERPAGGSARRKASAVATGRPPGERDAVVLARLVAQPPAGRRATPSRRRRGSARCTAPSATSASASSPSVSPASSSARPSQATASSRRSPRHAERRARVAAGGDVGVELARARREALVVAAARRAPPRTSSGPAWSRSPRGRGGQVVAAGDRHARARRRARRRAARPTARRTATARGAIAARAQLAQRRPCGPREEAADQRLGDAVLGAPGRERRRAAARRTTRTAVRSAS